MKLIVGLGNPGKEYSNTRHNIGFHYIDYYAKMNNVELIKTKFNGKYIDFSKNSEKIILLKPQSYMNLSGEVIKKYIEFFKINLEDIIIIHDDLDINFGKYKLKSSGSSGGHNGLKNIELHLGTKEYKRLKIGISKDKNIDTKDYVLGKFQETELKQIEALEEIVKNIIDDFLLLDFEKLMAKYNKK